MRKLLGIFLCLFFLAACGTTSNASTSTANHNVPAQATTGNVFRVQLVAGVPGWIYPAVDVASHDQVAIAQFVAHAKTLTLVTGEVYCPMDTGYALHLVERNASGDMLFAGDVSVTGCKFLTMTIHGALQAYWTDASFWQALSQLAGQTMPPQGKPANS
jgi:hypothetical protein